MGEIDDCNRQPDLGAHLLACPEEVFYGYIFPNLELHELLRLRLVCRTIKTFSNGFIGNNFAFQELEINETDTTFSQVLQWDLVTHVSAIYINNTGPEIFEQPSVPQFLQLFADKFTHLRVHHFSTCISVAEHRFFSALSNLQHMEVEFTDATHRQRRKKSSKVVNGLSTFPSNFKNLKTLKLHVIQLSSHDIENHRYSWDLIEFCTKLEYLKHPFFNPISTKRGSVEAHNPDPFAAVKKSINLRNEEFPNEPNLKFYDLQHHQHQDYHLFKFMEFVPLCHELGVKLLNVPAELYTIIWLNHLINPDEPRLNHPSTITFLTPLVSVNNFHGFMCLGELPNLEKITIPSTAKASFTDAIPFMGEVPTEWGQWPKLKIIDLTIDSEEIYGDPEVPNYTVDSLLKFLFAKYDRQELTELSIRFAQQNDLFPFPLPRAQDISNSCVNITKLTLTNWLGTNAAVSKFWKGLPLLEEVTLEKCQKLADVAFVGKRKEEPTFLRLNKLRKLTLKGLHVMKLTDLIFNLVFRHLKIKEFHLQSDLPLKLITIAGIESLLTGDFNNFVDKFPFLGWELEGVSDEEFSQLNSRFRAHLR